MPRDDIVRLLAELGIEDCPEGADCTCGDHLRYRVAVQILIVYTLDVQVRTLRNFAASVAAKAIGSTPAARVARVPPQKGTAS